MKTHIGILAVVLGITLGLSTPALASYYFASEDGAFVTLVQNGSATTYRMDPSTGGEPAFDGANLGTLSLADSNTLVLNVFSNKTFADGGHFIGGGMIYHTIRRVGESWGSFSTNFHNSYIDLGSGWEVHYGSNLNVNLLSGLTNGTYEIAVYAAAQGNFSPLLVEDNSGSNYVATFTVTEDPLPEPVADITDQGRVILSFAHTTNTGYGNELFIVGNHPDVGNWNPVEGRKLHWSNGNVWTGQVAVEAGHALEYKYIVRTNSAADYCDGANVEWMPGANLATNIPAQADAPYTSKAMYYYSGWTSATLVYQSGLDTNWTNVVMTKIGEGRHAGESLYYADGFGAPGELLTFVPSGYSNSTEHWDHSPANGDNYYTPLDVFVLQDGNVYNYWPPSSVSVSRISKTNVTTALPHPLNARDYWVYLPRGYDENTWKKYPVLYMHDGTNVFQPGGIYGTWSAETNADSMISLGMMRETIIVAVDNSTNRSREYIPPDGDAGAGPGLADQYGSLLIDYVKPMVESQYRVLTNVADTAVMGSSFGGLVSLYLGIESNAFGKIGAMSSAVWPAPYFVGRIDSNDTYGARVYLDMGTGEPSLWDESWQLYDMFLKDGYAANHDLRYVVGCGHVHNEGAWDQRLPGAYTFLLNILDEPNLLAQSDNPPEVTITGATNADMTVSVDTLKGRRYRLDRTDDLMNPAWTGVATSGIEQLMWSSTTLSDTSNPVGSTFFYRVSTLPWPE